MASKQLIKVKNQNIPWALMRTACNEYNKKQFHWEDELDVTDYASEYIGKTFRGYQVEKDPDEIYVVAFFKAQKV